ncbi:MAG: aspartate carbamoyltransferase catalytic subunit [Bdellovibrionota bacterium]
MSFHNRHFINFINSKQDDILFLFDKADKLAPHYKYQNKNACLLFFEPSTRTQISFDLAVRDCGMQSVTFNPESSSLKKGETVLDTLLNLEAMGFDLFIIRHGYPDENLKDLSAHINAPIINAGEGMSGHPTQALLDCYTISKERKNLKGEKVLFVGDIKHSRVVQSNIELMKILGIEVALCAPEGFLPLKGKYDGIKIFDKLEEGMEWATVLMSLRTQFERHEEFGNGIQSYAKLKENFVKNYSITEQRLKNWKKDGIIMHPGPFNRGIEIQSEILDDPRNCIFKQVENGRKIRRALIDSIIGDGR